MALSGQRRQGPHHRGGDNCRARPPPPANSLFRPAILFCLANNPATRRSAMSAGTETPPGKIAAAILLRKPQAAPARAKKQTPLHFFID
jgi:hypothetical protein